MKPFFTDETFRFFSELAENNHKAWFEANKHRYETRVYQPIKDLVTTLSPAMTTIDLDFELRPHRATSRIYRDTRFSHNKTPYKECMWLVFQQPASRDMWTTVPAYYMEVSKNGTNHGLGLFRPKKKLMDAFRDEISYMQDEFQAYIEQEVYARGFSLGGEKYKRLPKEASENPFLADWIYRKGVYVEKSLSADAPELRAENFAQLLEADFLALQRLYNIFKDATEL